MGGKQNRTKNNVRPSNSGRSAAMLHSNLPQFSGFSTTGSFKSSTSTFAFNSMEAEFDASIDDNIKLILKKVLKKDCTTKLKALQELAELLSNSELAIIKTLLPAWSGRYYNILVVHPDNRIREATQIVHNIIVLKAKREIAPYLKQLMAPWYISQYDNYPPASLVAIQAFKSTFSPAKFKEAVTFCHQEILNYINDNLIQQTVETVSLGQLSVPENEARYERIIISSLQGYAMYISEVDEDIIKQSIDLNKQIIGNKKFWKFAQNKSILIRSSWFQLLSVILQKATYLFNGNKDLNQIFGVISGGLEETESSVLPHIWECLLLATSSQEWFRNVNTEQLISKIINVLKKGGNGNASVIYPNFLPLYSNMSVLEETKSKQFYINSLDKMSLSLKLKSVASNSQETKAISTAYCECSLFIISQNVSNNILLCKSLLKQLCDLLQWCFNEAAYYQIIFNEVAILIAKLSPNTILIEFLLTILFEEFSKNNKEDINNLLIAKKQTEFLCILKKSNLSTSCLNLLENFVNKLFEIYLNSIIEHSAKELFECIYSLLNTFGTKSILEKIQHHDEGSVDIIYIYRNWFKNWLNSDSTYCKSVLDLIFLLLQEIDNSEDIEEILNDLLMSKQPNCIIWSVSKALSKPHIDKEVVRKWFKTTKIGEFFVSIAKAFIIQADEETDPEINKILMHVLGENEFSKILISKSAIEEVIEEISLNLNGKSSTESAYRLANAIHEAIYASNAELNYADNFLNTLFNLACKSENEKILNLWCQTFKILHNMKNMEECKEMLMEHLMCIERELEQILISKKRSQIDSINKIIKIIYEEINGSNYSSELSTWIINDVLSAEFNKFDEDILKYCKIAEYVKGNLESLNEELSIEKLLNEDDILKFFTWYFIKFKFIEICIDNDHSKDNLALEAFYFCALTTSFLEHFNNVKNHKEYSYIQQKFEDYLCMFINEISVWDTRRNLMDEIRSRSMKFGWFWAKAASNYFCSVSEEDLQSLMRDNNTTKGEMHMRQLFGSFQIERLSEEKVFQYYKELEAFKNENLALFSYENFNDLTWSETNQLIKVIKHSAISMEKATLCKEYWDLIVLAMVPWTTNCLKAKNLLPSYQYQALVVAVSELYIAISKKVIKLKEDHLVVNRAHEWDDLIVENVHNNLLQLWYHFAETFAVKNIEDKTLINLPFLQAYGKITDFLRSDLIFNKASPSFPKWTKFLKFCTNTLLTHSQPILQLWGFKMLQVLVPDLIKIDDQSINTTTPHKNGLIFEQFKEQLNELEEIVDAMLMDIRIGENSGKIEPSFDSFTYIFAYLLLWNIMISLYENATAELRFQYCDWLKNGTLLNKFLINLFKLVPIEVVQQEYEGKLNNKLNTDQFLNNPLATPDWNLKYYGGDTVENMACYLYKITLEHLPVLVRQWWTLLDIKTSLIVEKITTYNVSPEICSKELTNVIDKFYQNAFKNLRVNVMPSIREIQAVYTIDEAQMELSITLPTNYPLGSPEIECNRQISGTNQKQWLLQFKKCVLHQNGKIWDGLFLWTSNLDKKFDGIEECYICYAVLHSGTYQLPKLTCRTCKKKFHSVCLYKWFSSSNKSSCPICRNLF